MNKEKYISKLMQESAYCRCPSLTGLFEKRMVAQRLEASCQSFKDNADLDNPNLQDARFLRDYQKDIGHFKSATRAYCALLFEHAERGDIYFSLHNVWQEGAERQISLKEARKLLNERKPVITLHCTSCDQQIEVVSSIN